MEKCSKSFVRITFIVAMITAGILSAAVICRAESGKAYVSTQDGTKVLVFNLANNQLMKSIDIYKPTPLAQILPPNANDMIVVDDRIFITVPGTEISKAGINEIKVIDTRSDTVVGAIKTDLTPSGLLEYKGRIYVVNRYGNTIQEIDPGSLKIVRTIPFTAPVTFPLNNPITMEIANGKIYLPYPGGLARPGLVQVLDLQTGASLKVIEFSAISPYGPLAVKKVSEGKIYLGGIRSVAVLDTQSDRIIRNIPLSGKEIYVQSFAISGENVYTANGVSTVSVINIPSDILSQEIDTGYHDYACHLKAGIAAAGNKIFVSDAGRGIKIIDAMKNKIILTIASGEPVGPIAIIGSK